MPADRQGDNDSPFTLGLELKIHIESRTYLDTEYMHKAIYFQPCTLLKQMN